MVQKTDTSRLVLGTAQLGMPYGIANRTGKPSSATAFSIVETAWEKGIKEFDTAQGYGDSEKVLGTALAQLDIADQVKIITKLAPDLDCAKQEDIINRVKESLERLGCDRLYGLMLHDETWLDSWGTSLYNTLSILKKSGVVQYLGVSVYSPARAFQAIDLPGIDMVQMPANVLDRRFLREGVLEKAEKKSKKIYVRSIFLQGLLLMDSDQIPDTLRLARPYIERFNRFAGDVGLEPRELALAYVRSSYPGAGIVIGAELPEQVASNRVGWDKTLPDGMVEEMDVVFADVGEPIVNPALWKLDLG